MTYIVSLVGENGNKDIEYIHAKSPQEAAQLYVLARLDSIFPAFLCSRLTRILVERHGERLLFSIEIMRTPQ